MGGNYGFSKLLNGSICKIKKPPDVGFGWFVAQHLQGMATTIYVDMSVLLHAIHATSDLGFGSFVVYPASYDEVEQLAERYLSILQRYLRPIVGLPHVSLVFVFEKGRPKFFKRQSRLLNGGIRNTFLHSFHGHVAIGRNMISKCIGLPPMFVQRAIGRLLCTLGRVVFAPGESDLTIFQMALEVKHANVDAQVYVYSTDSDYLVFSDQIDGLIGPIMSKR